MVDLPQFVFPDLEVCQRCDGTNRIEEARAGVGKWGSKHMPLDGGKPVQVEHSTWKVPCPLLGPDHVSYPPDERFTLYRTDPLGHHVAVSNWDPWPGRVEHV